MIGAMIGFLSETLPSNVLPCDGTQYHRVDYPLLYAVLPDDYIDDADHFHTPNMGGRTLFGETADEDYPIDLGELMGQALVTLGVPEMPAHAHHFMQIGLALVAGTGTQIAAAASMVDWLVDAVGGDEGHDNMSPGIGVVWGIVAR